MCFRWLWIKTHRSVQMAMRLPFCDPWCCRVTCPLKLESTNDVGIEDDIIAISNCKGTKKVPYCTTVETVYPRLFPPFSPCFPDMFHRFPISRPTHGTWKRSLPPEAARPPWWESTPSGSSSWQRPA